jgi:hypothetical protein
MIMHAGANLIEEITLAMFISTIFVTDFEIILKVSKYSNSYTHMHKHNKLIFKRTSEIILYVSADRQNCTSSLAQIKIAWAH